MPLPFLFAVPGDDEGALQQFMFWHQADHLEIQTALQTQLSINLPMGILYPFDLNELQAWLLRHQSVHNDVNAALQRNSGTDLGQLNFKDPVAVKEWIYQNASEHAGMRAALAI